MNTEQLKAFFTHRRSEMIQSYLLMRINRISYPSRDIAYLVEEARSVLAYHDSMTDERIEKQLIAEYNKLMKLKQ